MQAYRRKRTQKKRDNEYYARLIKSATSPSTKASNRKSKIDHATSHDRNDLVHLADTDMLISSNWPTTVNGAPGIFLTFLDVAKKLGYQIVPCEK